MGDTLSGESCEQFRGCDSLNRKSVQFRPAVPYFNGGLMTKEQLIQRLKDLAYDQLDEEMEHIDADNALLEFINDPEITKAYEAINKWYA